MTVFHRNKTCLTRLTYLRGSFPPCTFCLFLYLHPRSNFAFCEGFLYVMAPFAWKGPNNWWRNWEISLLLSSSALQYYRWIRVKRISSLPWKKKVESGLTACFGENCGAWQEPLHLWQAIKGKSSLPLSLLRNRHTFSQVTGVMMRSSSWKGRFGGPW